MTLTIDRPMTVPETFDTDANSVLCQTERDVAEYRDNPMLWAVLKPFSEVCTKIAQIEVLGKACGSVCQGHQLCLACYELSEAKGMVARVLRRT